MDRPMPDLRLTDHQLFCCALDGKGGAAPVDLATSDAWSTSTATLWAHLDYSDDQQRQWLSTQASLDPLVVEALLAEDTRPRVTPHGDGLLIALRGINLTPGADPEDMVSVRAWVTRERIITTRRRDLLSIDDIIDQLNRGDGPCCPGDFLTTLVHRLVWRMTDTIEQFEDQIADMEDRILEAGDPSLRFDIASLRRRSIKLRRYLAPQRDALTRLLTEKADYLTESHRLRVRESLDRLMRHIEDLDAVREQAAVTQEELLNRLSEHLNKRMYVLSVVAAIFLPLGFLTGLLGINVGGIPGSDNAAAFWIFIGILLLVVAFQVVLFRWKKWF